MEEKGRGTLKRPRMKKEKIKVEGMQTKRWRRCSVGKDGGGRCGEGRDGGGVVKGGMEELW